MKPEIHIFVFSDALGWELARERQVLADLLPRRNKCETLFGYSSTCDPSILTGCLPREHGHFSFFVRARDQKPFAPLSPLAILPHPIAGHHRVRNKISRLLARVLGYTGYFQLYSVPFDKLAHLDYTEKRDIYEPGGIINGQRTIFEYWQDSGRLWVRSDWRLGDDQNLAHLREILAKGEVELAYLFTAGLDAVMHRHGTSGPAVDEAFEGFERNIRAIHDLASQHYQSVRLSVFSDHGMTNVSRAVDLLPRFQKLPWKYGRDYVAVWDSTMVRFWFQHGQARQEIMDWLREQKDGAIVPPEQLQQWGCDFADHRYGELFYLLPPGSLFVPSFLNQRLVTGMHGYTPDDPHSAACWLTNHPTATARQLTDIFTVMRDAAVSSSAPTPPSTPKSTQSSS